MIYFLINSFGLLTLKILKKQELEMIIKIEFEEETTTTTTKIKKTFFFFFLILKS